MHARPFSRDTHTANACRAVVSSAHAHVHGVACQRGTADGLDDDHRPWRLSFTVTYTWSGFSGTRLDAQVALAYRAAGGLNVFFAFAEFPNQVGSSGSVSATFTLTGTPTASHPYFGRGALLAPAKKGPYTQSSVRDSVVSSGLLGTQVCGTTATVS